MLDVVGDFMYGKYFLYDSFYTLPSVEAEIRDQKIRADQEYHDQHRPRATKYCTNKFYNFQIKPKKVRKR